jgi:hypothetical protein
MTDFKISMSPQQLTEKAREITGITTIIDEEINEPLTRLVHALNTEAQLSESGAVAASNRILRILSNRLRMLRDFENHPEISEIALPPIAFLTGGPRTGSTKLHKLLAYSGDFKYLKLWHGYSLSLRTGSREEDPNDRIKDTDKFTQWFNEKVPMAKMTHFFETQEPEEESFILEHAGFGTFMMPFFFIPSFIQWHVAHNAKKDFLFLRKSLQYLQWQFYRSDDKPWVLKYPSYVGFEPILAEVFPEGKFIATHRNPVDFFASGCSLVDNYYLAYSEVNRKKVIGQMLLEGIGQGLNQAADVRHQKPELNILEISYSQLLGSDEEIIKQVYQHLDMPLSSRAEEAMQDWSESNKQHKHGTHKYSLSDFSITKEQINSKCKNYIDTFGKYF